MMNNENSPMKKLDLKLHGLEQYHLEMYDDFLFEPLCIPDLIKLNEDALSAGIEIQPVSSFRGFEQQLFIWNGKACGEKTLLDSNSKILDFNSLTKEEIVFAILRWSALPGFSRHHWGSDFDVIDAGVLKENPEYDVQLIPSEYEAGGIFEKLGSWLKDYLAGSPFSRPYEIDQGGVAPEPWHLSHKASALIYEQKLHFEYFDSVVQGELFNHLDLNEIIRERSKDIFEKYVINTCS